MQIGERVGERVEELKPVLDRLYESFNYPDSAADPIRIVRRWQTAPDREIVGLCAAALAFGRVSSVLQSIERVVDVMDGEPAAFVRRFDPRRHGRHFSGIVHRWTRGPDLAALVWILRQMLDRSGSIEQFFLEGDEPGSRDVEKALDNFSRRALTLDTRAAYGRVVKRPGVAYFFPRPSAGSACKRLNLFLRWMIRRDALDLGVWSGVSPARLVVPLDIHVIRVGRCLGLTRYSSPGWRMAHDITESLRRLDPDDPVKYDFALCHIGMMKACRFGRGAVRDAARSADAQCPLRGHCSPSRGARTARAPRKRS